MKGGAQRSFGAQLKELREVAGFTQEELATIAGLSVHAVSALERGERRRPHVETVRALSAALDLTGTARDAFVGSARARTDTTAVEDLSDASLPLSPTALLGREADLETLRNTLADPSTRLITLLGPGGVGKSRLALELARTVSEEGPTRVVFVPLAAIRDSAFVASAIAEALGLADVAARDLSKRARIACGDRPTLILLDNFEHVLDAAPVVADLLTSVTLLRLLVTSRAPLRVRGEREYAVGPLELETGTGAASPADLARVPAVRLFLERVRDVQPDFRLTSANGTTVMAICRRLDALPLALELAAPWMKVLTTENLLHRLANDALFSIEGPRDLPERQQTMNATVAWGYQLLPPDEQRAFRRLGALPGLFSIDAAADVLAGGQPGSCRDEEALRLAAGLINKSLLLRADPALVTTCPLYYMLETVRAYAARELAASGELDEAHEGLVRHAIHEASLAAEGLVGPSQVEWLDRVREGLENYRGALTWLIEHGRPAEASHIAWGLMWFWVIRGQAEGLRWYEHVLNLPSLPPAAESRALFGASLMLFRQGELGRARDGLRRALALARAAGDMDVVVRAEDLFGRVEHALGNLDTAREWFTRSLERFKAAGSSWGAGHVLTGLARVVVATGDAGQAERLLDEATSTLRHAGPWFLARALYVRATLALQRENPDEAIAWGRESLTLFRQLHDKFAIVYALVPLAAAAAVKGDDLWAARILGARDAVTERTGAAVVDKRVQALGEQAEREVRARLGPDRWAQAYAAGRRASIDSLLKDIDRAPIPPATAT